MRERFGFDVTRHRIDGGTHQPEKRADRSDAPDRKPDRAEEVGQDKAVGDRDDRTGDGGAVTHHGGTRRRGLLSLGALAANGIHFMSLTT